MWETGYRSYPCSTSEFAIKKDLKNSGYGNAEYHGHITFHRDIICKTEQEAEEKLEKMSDVCDDHAIFYKDGRRKNWLVWCSYHS